MPKGDKLDKSGIKLRSSLPFKLRDRNDRNIKIFDMKMEFGFVPEAVVISKLHGHNNTIILSAVLPKEEQK